MSTDAAAALSEQPAPEAPYSLRLLAAGIVGRTWLWFVAGCLLVTLLPMLVGWRAFVVESGSMEPRLRIGDAVLAAPVRDAQDLLGRITVFTDPDVADRTKVHRVTAVNADGTLTTKGDANPTVDPTVVPMDDVLGLGRLLVRYVGLPLVWAQTGQWIWLGLFLLSLLLAGLAISRDQEDDDEADDPTDGPHGGLVPLPTRLGGAPASLAAATKPIDQGLRRLVSSPRWVTRTAYVAILASAVVLPTAGAAFAATTRNPTNTWSAGSWNYTSVVQGLLPWLYWKLDDAGTGTVVADSSATNVLGTYSPDGSAASFTKGVAGALTSDTVNRAVTLNSATSCLVTSSASAASAAPSTLTEVVWFRTTSTSGGKLLGFEAPRVGVLAASAGGRYDRHLYLDAAGQLWFGIGTTSPIGIKSAAGLNNGQWHMAAATLGPAGMALYVDGVQVATNASTAAGSFSGWWRAGCGNLSGWVSYWDGGGSPTGSSNQPRDFPFAGSLDEISIWQSVLTPAQIAQLYAAR